MLKLNGVDFTTGRARFFGRAPSSLEPTDKVYVTTRFPPLSMHSLVQLDTGAAWSMLDAEVAEALDLFDGDGQQVTVSTRLGLIQGRLERVHLILVADEGRSLELDATFLVSRQWTERTFLGWTGLLERARIALDPGENQFYFGEIP